MGFKLLQAPAIEPVTLAEAKQHCRVYTSMDDDFISGLIVAAREQCEAYCRQVFVTQKWRMYLDAFPGYIDQRLGGNIVTTPIAIGATSYMAGIRWAIVPPNPPVQSIDALSYISPNGEVVTLTKDVDYTVDAVSQPARATPMFGKFWPISRIVMNSVRLDWTAGYGTQISVGIESGSQLVTGAKFNPLVDVGAAITIPGAGNQGSPAVPTDLVTTIESVDANGVATLADAAGATVSGITMWWGQPIPSSIKTAIKMLVNYWYDNRDQAGEMPKVVQNMLSISRNLRI